MFKKLNQIKWMEVGAVFVFLCLVNILSSYYIRGVIDISIVDIIMFTVIAIVISLKKNKGKG
jgi:hypothetical protein